MSTEITINQDQIDINVDTTVVTIEAPQGGYPLPNNVYSVFGRIGNVVAQEGDYTLTQLGGVTITNPISGQALVYNGTSWVNNTETYVGTVTSVGLSNSGNALAITNSPITTAGTINIGFAGTGAQYIKGDGTLATFPTTIQQAQRLITEVYNSTGATLSKGTIVYINGGQGNLPTVTKAIATGDATSAQTYGVVQSDITDMNNGYVVVLGSLTDLDTQAYAVGTQLYLSGTTAGAWTSTKPYAPIHLVYVGIVVRSHPTQGVVEIRIQNGYELDELHDVSAQNPNNGDILQYVAATDLWTKTAGTTTNIAEGTNLYYTDARSRAAFSESVTGLDYNSTTGVLSTTTGYAIPTTASQATWNTAYNDSIVSAGVTGTTTKTLTLNQQDGGTITASWTDDNTDAVTSVFGRTGAVVATSGDYNTSQVTENTNLYFTNARAQNAITLTTTGTSGAATYSGGTLNIPQYQAVLTNPVTGTGTTNTLPKFTGTSAIGNSNITDTGSLITLGSNSLVSNALGIGVITNGTMSLRVSKTITGGTTSYGIYNSGTVQSDVTNSAWNNISESNTFASAFTLANYYHYGATQGTIGAGSAITTQRGFFAAATLIGATINYGFQGSIPSGTNRWNLYMDGTANNYMAGSLGIGTTDLTSVNLNVSKNITGSANSVGAFVGGNVQSDVTSSARLIQTTAQTAAASFTIPNVIHYYANQGTFGAGSVVTAQTAFFVEGNFSGATINRGLRSLVPFSANNWNLFIDGTANNYMAGSLGIGSTNLTGYNLNITKQLTGAVNAYGIALSGNILSDVTTATYGVATGYGTSASAFTLGRLTHFYANQGTIGATSAITNQHGFYVEASLTGATNNYGFYGNIPSGTNRWNLYMDGTANNYIAGSLGIGSTSLTGITLNIAKNLTGATASTQVFAQPIIQSDVTGTAVIYNAFPSTQAAAFTLGNLYYYQANQSTIGSTSAVTNQIGFRVSSSLTGATNNFAFRSELAAASNVWNLYMNGTANNYLAGSLGIGTTSITGNNLIVNKNITGSTNPVGIYNAGTIQSDATGNVSMYASAAAVVASAFTVNNIFHYNTDQLTIGSGATVTTQVGFRANNTLVGAGTNIGFQGRIPAQTNAWNLYMDGTANNYMAGALGFNVAGANFGNFSIRTSSNITGNASSSYGIRQDGTVQSDVTNIAYGYSNTLRTQATAFTLANYYHYDAGQATLGASSVVTNQTGFWAQSSMVGATNNYGFRGQIPSGTGRWNIFMDGTADNYLNGSLGIGSTTLSGNTLRVSRPITGSVITYAIRQEGQVQNDVTNQTNGFYNSLNTAASAFTLSNYFHFRAVQGTIGASSVVSIQTGFQVDSNLIGAATNYGFRGQIPAQANAWNIYMDGTANNYMAGSLGIGSTSLTNTVLKVAKSNTGATAFYGITSEGATQSDVTSQMNYFATFAATQATTFTLSSLVHFRANQSTFGAGSTVTSQYGFFADSSLIGATNDYGFYGNIASGTNRWNLYMAGTAANYMAGSLLIGSTSDNGAALQVTGSATISSTFTTNGSVIINPTASANSFIRLSYSGTNFGLIGSGSVVSGSANTMIVYAYGNNPLSLYTNNTERVRVKGTGQMRFVPLASDPTGAEAGDVYYNSTTNKLKVYNGTAWETITSA